MVNETVRCCFECGEPIGPGQHAPGCGYGEHLERLRRGPSVYRRRGLVRFWRLWQPPAPCTRYVYAWGNNPRRAELKGRGCRVLASGTRGTVLIEFPDTGERVTTSRRALRKLMRAKELLDQ